MGEAMAELAAAIIAAVLALVAPSEATTVEAAVWWATEPTAAAQAELWDDLAFCESSSQWDIDTGNGFYGGVQFHPTSWRDVGGQGLPSEWSRVEQIYRAGLLFDLQGAHAWPGCHSIGYLPHGSMERLR